VRCEFQYVAVALREENSMTPPLSSEELRRRADDPNEDSDGHPWIYVSRQEACALADQQDQMREALNAAQETFVGLRSDAISYACDGQDWQAWRHVQAVVDAALAQIRAALGPPAK
jgi:hypothetical protein